MSIIDNSVFELILIIEMIVDMWRSSFRKSFGQTEQVTGGIRLVTVSFRQFSVFSFQFSSVFSSQLQQEAAVRSAGGAWQLVWVLVFVAGCGFGLWCISAFLGIGPTD